MTSILVSRFLLNLQETNLRVVGQSPTTASDAHLSTVRFERALGTLGGSIFPEQASTTPSEDEISSDGLVDTPLEKIGPHHDHRDTEV